MLSVMKRLAAINLVSTVLLTYIQCEPMAIIDQSCNFVNQDTCVRVDTTKMMTFDAMKAECERYELQLLSPYADDLGTLRKVLYFRYPSVTQTFMNRKINGLPERNAIERDSGLMFYNTHDTTGAVVYRYEDNHLYTVPSATKLPLVCWGKFRPRYKCPPGFKLYAKRPTCFKWINRKMTNEQCKNACRAIKSNMGSFHSNEEKTFFVTQILRNTKPHWIWIGTRFPAHLNKAKHTDPAAIRKTAYNMDGSVWEIFENSFTGTEPNGSGEENCVEVQVFPGNYNVYNDENCRKNHESCMCESAPDQTQVQY